tara:strand:- start:847 stop:1797 length:951 start_codon:yes stop_codon:yes gene_type:complete
MSAFKSFLAQDIIVTPFEVNKSYRLEGAAQLTGSGVDRFLGTNLTSSLFVSSNEPTTGQLYTQYQKLVYNSIKELYYSNYLSSSYGDPAHQTVIVNGVILSQSLQQPQFDNYLQTTLAFERYFPTGSDSSVGVIAIPVGLFGDKVKPNSFKITSDSGSIVDDGEGNLVQSGSTIIVGSIVYAHGLAVIIGTKSVFSSLYGAAIYGTSSYGSNTEYILSFITASNITCSFSSSYNLFETQYKCTVSEKEFNYTLNPSLTTGSFNQMYNFVTGSDFAPYVTTVGLYNEKQELLAVGKLAQPVPTSRTTDMTFYINIDR